MTIKHESTSSAPSENEVMMNSTGGYAASAEPMSMGDMDIPFAHATSVEVDSSPQESPYATGPKTSSTGGSGIAVPTGSVIRSSNQPSTPQQQRGQTNRRADPCCNGQTCCCITSIIFTIVFLCCILPFIIMFVVAAAGMRYADEMMDDVIFNDDYWNQINEDLGNLR